MKKDIVKYRLEIIHSAQKIGISKAAELHGVDRSTIRRWIKKFESNGEDGLLNRSKKDIFQPKTQMSREVEEEIVNLKKNESKITIDQIKSRLNLTYSRSAIFKKLKDHGLVCVKKKDLSSELNENDDIPFTTFYLSVKKIDYDNSGTDKFRYQFILTEKLTKVQFISFSTDYDEINNLIFIDYFLTSIQGFGINCKNITIYLKRLNNKLLKSIVHSLEKKFSTSFVYSAKVPKLFNSNLIDKTIFKKLSNLDREHFIISSYAHLMLENSILFSKCETRLLKNLQSIVGYKNVINSLIYKIHPINLDIHFDCNKVLQYGYWNILNSTDIYIKASEELKTIGGSFVQKFENIKALRLYETIITATNLTGNLELQVYSLMHKGIILQKIGNREDALNLYQSALKTAKKQNFHHLQIKLLSRIGVHYYLQSDYKVSSRFFENSLKLSRVFQFKSDEKSSLLNLGALYLKNGNYEKSIKRGLKLLSILSDKDPRKITVYANLGSAYSHKKMLDKSMNFYHKGLKIAKNINSERQLAQILNNMGNIYSQRYEDKKSFESFIQLLTLATKQGNREWKGLAYNNIGRYYQNIGNYKNSLINYQNFYEISKELNDSNSRAISQLNIADLYIEIGSYKTALEEIESSINLFLSLDNKLFLPQAYLLKGIAALNEKNYFLADKSFKSSINNSKLLNSSDQTLKAEIYLNINKVLRVNSGYKRYSMSIEEIIIKILDQIKQLKELKSDPEVYIELLKLFYTVIAKIDKSTTDYKISLDEIYSNIKEELFSLYSNLYQKSKRKKYIQQIENYK